MEAVRAYRAERYDYREARELVEALGVSEPVAIALLRRGHRTPDSAREFLAAEESHPPGALAGMGEVVELALAAARAGRRVTVHGDFDVDGVCATAILLGALRELGADCDWLIPDRLGDGYGLSAANLERLAERGTGLLVTVDCGIAAVEEVELARSLGMEVAVTDHHRPGPELPACPVLHPGLGGYPFAELCGAAVAWKLACALREAAGTGGRPEDDLDLVALATVADVVPLLGENRCLVRRGLEEMRRARRPGVRALLEAAGCEPTGLDEGDLAFRLAPRVNAAGRLYRADAGVELFLTGEEGRAREIAAELSRANSERRAAEREVDAAAEAARRELPAELREAPGLVLAGEGWHPGVIGIVASRLAERHHRPVVVVSLDGDGGGRGSGRGIPGFDLLAALEACSGHLERFGGHRAAAGLELRAEELDAFREAFAAHAATTLGAEELTRTERVDAIVGGARLDLELAEELGRLAPFGMGNPAPRLLVPAARARDARQMGEGRHCRFTLHSGSHRALAVAFGRSGPGVGEEEPVDAAVRLEVNRWNGSEEPRLVLRELYPVRAHACRCPDGEWWARFERELRLPLEASGEEASGEEPRGREAVRAGGSPAATIAELLSSGAEVLAICADAARRGSLVALSRFAEGGPGAACERCGGVPSDSLRTPAVADYAALERSPSLAGEFEHVVLVDPPSSPRQEALARRPTDGWTGAEDHPGYLHEAWEDGDVALALAALEEQLARRPALISAFRDLREAGEASGEELLAALRGSEGRPRGPEAAARCFRVLAELGLVQGSPDAGGGTVRVLSSEETELERSAAYRAYGARHLEGLRYLERRQQT